MIYLWVQYILSTYMQQLWIQNTRSYKNLQEVYIRAREVLNRKQFKKKVGSHVYILGKQKIMKNYEYDVNDEK